MTVPSETPADFTEAAVQEMLRRAMRLVLALGLVLGLVFWLARGWQSGLVALAGAAISWTGIIEWRSLSRAVFAALEDQRQPKLVARTLVLFFLRLGAIAVIAYVSLKCFHGAVYPLLAGIGLAVVALSFEAVRLLRQ